MTLEELEQHRSMFAFDWVRARLAYLKSGKSNVWFQPLPDEIATNSSFRAGRHG